MATGNHKVQITVTATDLASQTLRNVEGAVGRMSTNFNRIGTFFSGFRTGLDSTIGKMDRLANSMYRFNMYTSGIQRNLRTIVGVGGLAAGAVTYQGLSNTLGFDYATKTMQSRMNVGSAARKEIEEYILRDLNTKVSFTPTQIAEMGITLGQGGISSTSDMKALMATTAYFSEAVGAIPDEAAEMIISAAKGFNISMDDSSQITDKLTMAVNSSLLHVEELPHALGQLSGRAAMFGQSLDSSLVALMASRDQGLSAAQAAQNMLAGFRSISYIGNEMTLFPRRRKYYEELGIDDSFFDKEKRQLKEFPEIIQSLEKTMINNDFINPRYKGLISSHDDFVKLRSSGELPEDFWDRESAMPLISRVFGAAGMTPIMMGLQAAYEEVDPETGEKTGEAYYGSEALIKMQEKIENSEGETRRTHEIIEESGLFNLQVLKGAWEAAQIDFLDESIPLITTLANELTGWLMGTPPKDEYEPIHGLNEPQMIGPDRPLTRMERVENAIIEVAENFREKGNIGTGNFIETVGLGITGGIRIGGTTGPLFQQAGRAFKDNFIDAEWGSNILEFPWHMVENGINFIKDILKANDEFQELVDKLPEGLQDPAKLVESLSKAGLVMLVTGAIVKVIELGVRGISTAMKVGKIALDLSTAIVNMVKRALGLGTEGEGGAGGLAGDLLDTTSNIHANVVNVYGKAINEFGPDGKRNPPPVIYGPNGEPLDKDGKPRKSPPPVIYGPDGKPLPDSKSPKTPKTPKMPKVGFGGILDILGTLSLTGWASQIAADYVNRSVHERDTAANKIFETISPYRQPGVTTQSKIDKALEGLKGRDMSQDAISAYKPKPRASDTGIIGTIPRPVKQEIVKEATSHSTREINLSTKQISTDFMKGLNSNKKDADKQIGNVSSKSDRFRIEGLNLTKSVGASATAGIARVDGSVSGIKSSVARDKKETFSIITGFDGSLTSHKAETSSGLTMLGTGLASHKDETKGKISSVTDGLKVTDGKINDVSSSIVSGFATANERLQNVRVDNQVNVNVPAATVTVTGNLKDFISVSQSRPNTSVRATSSPSHSSVTDNKIDHRRLGWR